MGYRTGPTCGGTALARLEGPGGGESQFWTDGVWPRYPSSVLLGMSEWLRGCIPAGKDPGRHRGRQSYSHSGLCSGSTLSGGSSGRRVTACRKNYQRRSHVV